MPLLNHTLWIAAGAALGANARYLISLWATARLGPAFPYATWIVNTTGSFALGFLLALIAARVPISTELRLLLAIGFLGSFTTFSTYAVESIALLQTRPAWVGLLNILGTNLACLLFVLLGMFLARRFV